MAKDNSNCANLGFKSGFWRAADELCGIDWQIAHGETFHNEHSADMKVDFILADTPSKVSDRGCECLCEGKLRNCDAPPAGNVKDTTTTGDARIAA